jgi:hypothetical protein
MDEEDRCMTMLCYFPNSWKNLVVSIRRTINTLVLHELFIALL